jgi:HPt (histidine-containing phosphotransfer) domain-containing protein
MTTTKSDPYRLLVFSVAAITLFFLAVLAFNIYALFDTGAYNRSVSAMFDQRINFSRLQRALLDIDPEYPNKTKAEAAYANFLAQLQIVSSTPLIQQRFPEMLRDLQAESEKIAELVVAYFDGFQEGSTKKLILPTDFIRVLDHYSPVLKQKQKDREGFYLAMETHIAVLVLALFMVLAVFFFNRLRLSDRETRLRAQETEVILANVTEGLLLLNKELRITEKYSSSLAGLLNLEVSRLKNADFIELLGSLVSEKTIKTAKEYISLLFQKHVKQKLITSLNPLERVTTTKIDDLGVISNRYLSFRFSRTLDEMTKEPLYVLVTIRDITEQVVFEERIQELEKNAQAQLELFLKIVHVEPQALLNALKNNEHVLFSINQDLKAVSPDNPSYLRLLQSIKPKIHTLKGNAGFLGLDILKSYLHDFESLLSSMESKGKALRGEDFILLATQLDKLLELISTIQKIAEKMQKNNLALTKPSDDVFGEARFQRLVAELGKKYNKAVNLEVQGLKDLLLPHDKLFILQNIFIQLISNAIVHGIEDVETRLKIGKKNPAILKLRGQQRNRQIIFVLMDDGQGIDAEKIRARLKARNPNQHWERLTQSQLLEYIFKPGFSLADNLTEDAGRGVGMQAVRENLSEIGASIQLKTEPGKFTAWQITLEV